MSEHRKQVWDLELDDLETVKKRNWSEDNFTETQATYKDLETLCQIRQFNYSTLESLSENELGYIAGRINPDVTLLIGDSAASPHTATSRGAKLNGNAIRAQFILDHKKQENLTKRARRTAIRAAILTALLTSPLAALITHFMSQQ